MTHIRRRGGESQELCGTKKLAGTASEKSASTDAEFEMQKRQQILVGKKPSLLEDNFVREEFLDPRIFYA